MPPNQFGAVNSSAPATTTGSIKRGNPTASQPLQGMNAGTRRNWGSNTNPPNAGGIAKDIGDTLRWNMRYGRNPFGSNNRGGRRTVRSAGGAGASDSASVDGGAGAGGITVNFGDTTFGSQRYLGATVDGGPTSNPADFGRTAGGSKFGDQTFLGSTTGGGGAVAQSGEFQQPQTRTRKPLTPEQKQRNAETAKARRALSSDIKKNGTAEQQQRVQEQGVAGGKTRQPRTKTAAAPAPRTIDARTIQANQSDASTKSTGAAPTGSGPSAPGSSFIGSGAVTGAQVTFGDSGVQVQGGKLGKNELAS